MANGPVNYMLYPIKALHPQRKWGSLKGCAHSTPDIGVPTRLKLLADREDGSDWLKEASIEMHLLL